VFAVGKLYDAGSGAAAIAFGGIGLGDGRGYRRPRFGGAITPDLVAKFNSVPKRS
jgi:hypothetical protein